MGTRWWRPGDTPTGATWQPRRSVGGQGDRDSDPAVSLWWPRPPHPPPAPLASGSWERLRAGTRRGPPGPCPFLQPPPLRGGGTGTSRPGALGELGKRGVPLGPPHPHRAAGNSAPTRCRNASGMDTDCPAASPRFGNAAGNPDPRGVAVPSSGSASQAPRHTVPQPLVFLPLLHVPDGTGDTKPHCGSDGLAGEARVCSRPCATTSDPPLSATPGDNPEPLGRAGGHTSPPPQGWC